MIESPILCAIEWTPKDAKFPYLATPKIDGIRMYTAYGDVWTRSDRPMPNLYLRQTLPGIFGDHFDGEIFVNGNFTDSHSFCSSHGSKPSVAENVVIHIFDRVLDKNRSYVNRVFDLHEFMEALQWKRVEGLYVNTKYPFLSIKPIYPNWIKDHSQLEAFYEKCLLAGYEGIILRDPDGRYKEGRSTLSEHLMMKWKPRIDRVAMILGVEELLVNNNPIRIGTNGKPQRSKAQEGLILGGTFGRFYVKDVENETKFYVGSGPGLTDSVRRIIWENRHHLSGNLIEYRCMPYGAKEGPRQPQFLHLVDERVL